MKITLDSVLTERSYYYPKAKLLKTLTINIKHGESMRGLKTFVPTTARTR
jgi:hypothetical protein